MSMRNDPIQHAHHLRRAFGIAPLLVVLVLALPGSAFALTETDNSNNFTVVGSNGYQANVPATSANLLALSGVTFSATGTNPNPNGGGGSSTSYATLTDGSYGLVPASGAGGPGEVGINSGTTLTYTLPTAYDLSTIDIFTGWGDNGRCQPNVTVSYSTIFAPMTFTTINSPLKKPSSAKSSSRHV